MTGCGNGKTFTRAATTGDDVYWGDSITYLCADWFGGLNRAWPGDTSIQTLELVEYYKGEDGPARHHIMIGVNDVFSGVAGTFAYRLNAIFAFLQGEIIFTSVLPTDSADKNEQIIDINNQARALAEHWGHTFRDVYASFSGPDGLLKDEYSLDGVHLTEEGCRALFK